MLAQRCDGWLPRIASAPLRELDIFALLFRRPGFLCLFGQNAFDVFDRAGAHMLGECSEARARDFFGVDARVVLECAGDVLKEMALLMRVVL